MEDEIAKEWLFGKQATYYVEENQKVLNMLISNCEPILSAIVSKFDSFNEYNNIGEAFESMSQQRGSFMSDGGYGGSAVNIDTGSSNNASTREETQEMHR
jgi:hypothetical protein